MSKAWPLTLPRGRLIGVLMGLGYGSGWAVCTVWLRGILDRYQPEPGPTMFYRGAFVSLFLFALIGPSRLRSVRPKHLPLLGLFGLVGIALNNYAWGYSVHLNGVTVATVLAYGAPIFTVLLSRPLFGERITRRKLSSLFLALAGCTLVSQAYDFSGVRLQAAGLLVALLVAISQSGRDLLGKQIGSLYPELINLFCGFAIGSAFLGSAQAAGVSRFSLPPTGWLELALMSVLVGASYLMYLGALRRLPVSVASILGLSEAVTAAFLAYLVHGEVLSAAQIAGAAMVVGGVALLEVSEDA